MAGRARVEVRKFLDRPPTPRISNPLETWEELKYEYRYFYKVAMKYLPLLATSIASERLFSRSGLIIDDHGSRLTSDHLSMRIFLAFLSKKNVGFVSII